MNFFPSRKKFHQHHVGIARKYEVEIFIENLYLFIDHIAGVKENQSVELLKIRPRIGIG